MLTLCVQTQIQHVAPRQFSYTIVLLLWRVSKQKFVWKIAFLRTSKAAAELRPSSSSQSQGNAILKVNNFSAETEKETTMDFCLHWSQKVKKWKPTCHKSSLAQLQSVVMPFAVFTTFVDDDEHLATDLFYCFLCIRFLIICKMMVKHDTM